MNGQDEGNNASRDGRLNPAWPVPDPEIADVLRQMAVDGSWGRYEGPHLERLIAALAEFHGVDGVYPCASGTFAVELALRSLGVEAGDEVVMAAYDFPGNFRAIEAIGATPVLVDIERTTTCLDARQFSTACGSGRVRATIVSHLHGGLADMQTLCELASLQGIAIVEDACQSVGAIVQGRRAGTWGDVGVLSFGGSKLLTAGRGGALLSRRADVLQRARIFCERGNHAFPLSEMQAAVLLPQLKVIDDRNRIRRVAAEQLVSELTNEPALVPITSAGRGEASHYKLAWWVCSTEPQQRDQLLHAARAIGAEIGPGFRGFHRRGARRCRRVGGLEISAQAAEQIVLLHHPLLLTATTTDLRYLARTMRAALHNASAGSD